MRRLTVALWSVLVVGTPAAAEQPGVAALLPGPAALAPWRATEPPAIYEGTRLSDFIDGAADVYFQYGFVRAATAEYAAGDEFVNCAVYEMVDAGAAFGVFSYFRTPQKDALNVGDGGAQSDLQLQFWQGRYFVSVETFSTTEAARGALSQFARAIAGALSTHATEPTLLSKLADGAVHGTEKLLRGRLVADALFLELPGVPIAADPDDVAIAAEYSDGARLIVLSLGGGGDHADLVWRQVASSFGADAACASFAPETRRVACARGGRFLVVRRLDDGLAIASAVNSVDEARALADRVPS